MSYIVQIVQRTVEVDSAGLSLPPVPPGKPSWFMGVVGPDSFVATHNKKEAFKFESVTEALEHEAIQNLSNYYELYILPVSATEEAGYG